MRDGEKSGGLDIGGVLWIGWGGWGGGWAVRVVWYNYQVFWSLLMTLGSCGLQVDYSGTKKPCVCKAEGRRSSDEKVGLVSRRTFNPYYWILLLVRRGQDQLFTHSSDAIAGSCSGLLGNNIM